MEFVVHYKLLHGKGLRHNPRMCVVDRQSVVTIAVRLLTRKVSGLPAH